MNMFSGLKGQALSQPHVMKCWVCGKKLGGKFFNPNATCSIMIDPIGLEHRCHHVCKKDADGKFVRIEYV